MKCYVLMLAKEFPKGHINEGYPTQFKEKLWNGVKKHTIRQNFDLWGNRAHEVNEGKAYISVRQWTGKPYRSQQVEILTLKRVVVEPVELKNFGQYVVDGSCVVDKITLATNDGLSVEDFDSWFPYFGKEKCLIHFNGRGHKNRLFNER